jgi:hypothetical protein
MTGSKILRDVHYAGESMDHIARLPMGCIDRGRRRHAVCLFLFFSRLIASGRRPINFLRLGVNQVGDGVAANYPGTRPNPDWSAAKIRHQTEFTCGSLMPGNLGHLPMQYKHTDFGEFRSSESTELYGLFEQPDAEFGNLVLIVRKRFAGFR